MKKRILLQHSRVSPAGQPQSPRTGDHCPATGWWAALNGEEKPQFITEGSIMPSVGGSPAAWKLAVCHPQRAQAPRHDFPPKGFALDAI
ncbi:hypothetical protein ACFUTU_16255 [Arthrobacter sp. NPDC057388]|jgi:hypothetical protein|uniref:hypothetical protein n=1 Tax=Arthrobacter sp. NPDC057388 TaxID=3346116 RepID=UPI00362C8B04